MSRSHLRYDEFGFKAAHQREANRQARKWLDDEIAKHLGQRKPDGYTWRTIGDRTQVWPVYIGRGAVA